MFFPLNSETTPLLSQTWVTGAPRHPWNLARPLPRRSTHHTTVSRGDEATVHRDKAAAVQGLWGENGAKMPEAMGPWGTASMAFLNPKVEALPSSQVQSLSWP